VISLAGFFHPDPVFVLPLPEVKNVWKNSPYCKITAFSFGKMKYILYQERGFVCD